MGTILSATKSSPRSAPAKQTTVGEDGELVETDVTVEVRDFEIVVCHDDKCPGADTAGHGKDKDATRHHTYHSKDSLETDEEVIAWVAACEKAEREASPPESLAAVGTII